MLVIRPGFVNRNYEASEQDTTGPTYQYFGFLTLDGAWVIQRFDLSVTSIITYRYAAFSNNSAYASYPSAWTDRATLTYDYYSAVKI